MVLMMVMVMMSMMLMLILVIIITIMIFLAQRQVIRNDLILTVAIESKHHLRARMYMMWILMLIKCSHMCHGYK